jgi:hypothetical protein
MRQHLPLITPAASPLAFADQKQGIWLDIDPLAAASGVADGMSAVALRSSIQIRISRAAAVCLAGSGALWPGPQREWKLRGNEDLQYGIGYRI